MCTLIDFLRSLIINHGVLWFLSKGSKRWVIFSFSVTAYFNKNHPSNRELDCLISAAKNSGLNVLVFDHRRLKPPFWVKFFNVSHVVGFGQLFSWCALHIKDNVKVILYLTGMYPNFVFKEYEKFSCKLRKEVGSTSIFFGELGKYMRLSPNMDPEAESRVNSLICIGNQDTRKSLTPFLKRVSKMVNPIISNSLSSIKYKAREVEELSHMLLVLSKGCLHKGLYQALYICRRDKLKITIAGVSQDEMKFVSDLCGFFEVESKIFGFMDFSKQSTWRIFNRCDFAFCCSLSEGMSTTVLALSDFGIPIVCNDRIGVDGLTPSFLGFPIGCELPELGAFNLNSQSKSDSVRLMQQSSERELMLAFQRELS